MRSTCRRGDGMPVLRDLPSALFDLKPRRFIVATFAIGALLLCAFLMHSFGLGQNHESLPTAASTVHVEADAGSHSTLVAASHGTQASIAQSDGASGLSGACGAGCGGSDAIQIACILAFLRTVVFFIFFLPRLLSTNQRLRERAIDMVVSVRAGPRPMTPSPQELSISRT